LLRERRRREQRRAVQPVADALPRSLDVVQRDQRTRRRHDGIVRPNHPAVRIYVTVYSGPLPPSGGVSRPPFAVIAPHCTQFDGVTSTSTFPASSRPTSYTCAGHILAHIVPTSRGTRRSILM